MVRKSGEDRQLVPFYISFEQRCANIDVLCAGHKNHSLRHAKIVFLIHQTKAGRLIGKKGTNIKKIRGEKNSVYVTISKEPIDVDAQSLVTVTCVGPQKDMESKFFRQIGNKNF